MNDFNLFGRTYQVVAQAEAPFRDSADDITRFKTRNAQGQMVPLGALVLVPKKAGLRIPWDDQLRLIDVREVLATVDEIDPEEVQ